MVTNQCPLIHGVNDNPEVLAELFHQVAYAGAIPYYLFQCRPAVGNKAYTLPIETAYTICEQAKRRLSGLAKRFRYVMSHATGKIEIIGKTDDRVYMKYHRAARDEVAKTGCHHGRTCRVGAAQRNLLGLALDRSFTDRTHPRPDHRLAGGHRTRSSGSGHRARLERRRHQPLPCSRSRRRRLRTAVNAALVH